MASGYVVVPWGWRREVEDDSVYYIRYKSLRMAYMQIVN